MPTDRKPGDPSTDVEIKDLEGHIKDVVEEALKHGHARVEIAEALVRVAEDLNPDEDEDDGA